MYLCDLGLRMYLCVLSLGRMNDSSAPALLSRVALGTWCWTSREDALRVAVRLLHQRHVVASPERIPECSVLTQ